ncbi:hypothetical protein CKO25_12630 [Thiocapsa imhoffii]|uniref:Uncharacterized protein n=1 Tax=Thiocapsa imhoffii TaxID=382777 RepID=A0A9X0WJ06_9GAMM|nr:hypothetical protein [Thiocapsa imhoffii]MBK1645473.1 hypothetical protein [Thiocapsa imhoffii]
MSDAIQSPLTDDIKTQLTELIDRIRYYASWSNHSGATEIANYSRQCLELDPDCQERIDQARVQGQADGELLTRFYRFGSKFGKDCLKRSDYRQALADLNRDHPSLVKRAEQNVNKGMLAKKKYLAAQKRKDAGQPVSKVRMPAPVQPNHSATALPEPSRQNLTAEKTDTATLHPRDLRAQAASAHWQLMIDETGSSFGPEASGLHVDDRQLGRFVGLLIPQPQAGLQPLPKGWHAVEQGEIDEIDRVIQAVLDAPVGVLGITMLQLPEAPGERWVFGVIRLIDLVLRLMPLDGPTALEVLIENRGSFKGQAQWPAVAEQARLRLADAYPDRARAIELRIRIITKHDSPYNGYVDALAYIASGASEHSRACLNASGLPGTCLIDGDAETIARALEWMDRGRTLDGRDWTTLLAQPDAEQPSSLVNTLLERLGATACHDTALWRRYLDHVTGHFDSRNLDLKLLGRQVVWLERWMPVDQKLPPTLRLLWLTSNLARANHLGQTEQPWVEEMRQLANRLMEEDARLVCRAELNLAVTATNRYDFEQAGEALRRWNPTAASSGGKMRGLLRKLLGDSDAEETASPKSTAGLRYWGQVRSSLGQHRAFMGDPAGAVAFFDEALESFGALSDPESARRESRQTQTYRAIALMDDMACDGARVRAAVEAVTGPMPQALERLAASIDHDDKYAHHLALRWLVHRPDADLARHYLDRRDDWSEAEGHPWPLIQLYRALLLHPDDPAAARERAVDGARLAEDGANGPVVHLIGACIRAVAVGWGEPWEGNETVLRRLESDLPLAHARIAHIRAALCKPLAPLDLLREVLPFNFR